MVKDSNLNKCDYHFIKAIIKFSKTQIYINNNEKENINLYIKMKLLLK